MTIQCCVCKKVKDEESWTKQQVVSPKDVSHTYCPICLNRSRADFAKEVQRANLSPPVTVTV